jgi:hypothetical protein
MLTSSSSSSKASRTQAAFNALRRTSEVPVGQRAVPTTTMPLCKDGDHAVIDAPFFSAIAKQLAKDLTLSVAEAQFACVPSLWPLLLIIITIIIIIIRFTGELGLLIAPRQLTLKKGGQDDVTTPVSPHASYIICLPLIK